MGPPEKQPPFPEFDWTRLPAAHRYVSKFRLECNYLQAMEGDYDPSHGAFLHMTLADRKTQGLEPASNLNNGAAGRWMTDSRSWGRLEDSDSGVLCLTDSQLRDGSFFATAGAIWMMPVFCTHAVAGTGLHAGSFRVPIDNVSCMFFRLRWSYEPLPEAEVSAYRNGGSYYPALIPGTWTPRDNLGNDYNIDRIAQRHFTFSGIKAFPSQDAAMVENQRGRRMDRTREHLTSADRHIIHVRNRLLRAVEAMAAGHEPTEPWHPEAYRYHYESAVAAGRDEAVAEARAKAMSSRLAPLPELQVV
jgi:phenylpropionate dioxygenase-like ring-hydroxylating dioxygenase large terminal subunit